MPKYILCSSTYCPQHHYLRKFLPNNVVIYNSGTSLWWGKQDMWQDARKLYGNHSVHYFTYFP